MGELRFELKPVAEKPERTKKGSKYELIIKWVLSGGHDLIRVDAENKDENYLRVPLVEIINREA